MVLFSVYLRLHIVFIFPLLQYEGQASEICVCVVFTSFAGKKKASAINLDCDDSFPTCFDRQIPVALSLKDGSLKNMSSI